MSRYTFTVPAAGETAALTAAYGFDHAMGYFLDIFKPGQDEPILTYDSNFDGRNTGEKLTYGGYVSFPFQLAKL